MTTGEKHTAMFMDSGPGQGRYATSAAMVFGGGQAVIDRVTHLGLKKDQKLVRSRSCSYVDAFYKSTTMNHDATWKSLGDTRGKVELQEVPKMREVLDVREQVRRPVVLPEIDHSRYPIQRALKDEEDTNFADPVLSAPICPKKFPVRAPNIVYPKTEKAGIDNPLYATSAMTIGAKKPLKHQLPDYFFPRSNTWSSSYTDKGKPRTHFLNTRPTFSAVVHEFDRDF